MQTTPDATSDTNDDEVTRPRAITALPEFLTVPELAHYLRIGRGHAYDMARTDPRLRAVKFGRLVRIPRQAVLDLQYGRAGQHP